MSERYRHASGVGYSHASTTKMDNEFSPKKTMIILVIVVGCFAVLWPKVFYPMLVGSANQHMKPSAIDKTTGCCYVLSETDVDTIKIMSELCGNIIKEQIGDLPVSGKQIINICQDEVLRTCGIDISLVLQEQVRLGHTTKQILDEIRSLNGSLCLKYNFGIPPWRLGVPHLVTLKNDSANVRQERPAHVRSEMVHPAFRERGRAIPQEASPSRPPKRIIEGRPGPLPGMRPTIGGAGHVVPPSKQGTGSMSVIMPIYTIGIVIFFTYTLMKIIFKKHPDTDTIYSTREQDGRYRKDVLGENSSRGSRDVGSCKLVVNAMSALLDEVDQEIEARRQSSEVVMQDDHSTSNNLSNGSIKKEDKPSVKIMGMETSESCEDGKKWQSSNSSVLPAAPQPVNEHVAPPQEIYLDRALPPQSQILVADSAIETEKNYGDDPSVVLAGKMTLSVISLENENIEFEEGLNTGNDDTGKREILENSKPVIEEEINNIIEEAIENLVNNKHDDLDIKRIQDEAVTTILNENNNIDNETEIISNETDLEENIEENLDVNQVNDEKNESKSLVHEDRAQKQCVPNRNGDVANQNDVNTEIDEPKITTSLSNANSTPLLNLNAKSSSEESGSTVLSVSNQGSVINVNTRDVENEGKEGTHDQGVSEEEEEEEEYEVEYEESEEEIEVSEDEEEVEENEVTRVSVVTDNTQRLHANGDAVRINEAVPHNGNPEEEESDEEEIMEEIIEEYSEEEEEEEEESGEETDEVVHLSSNGNGGD